MKIRIPKFWSCVLAAWFLAAFCPAHAASPKRITPVNVYDFGARGDGVTDDQAAIQRAINSCTNTGGTVFFSAGTYAIKSPLIIPGHQKYKMSTVKLEGEGRDRSLIQWSAATNGWMVIVGCGNPVETSGTNKTGGSGFSMRGLSLVSQIGPQTTTNSADGVYIYGVNSAEIVDVRVEGYANNGVVMWDVYGMIDYCQFASGVGVITTNIVPGVSTNYTYEPYMGGVGVTFRQGGAYRVQNTTFDYNDACVAFSKHTDGTGVTASQIGPGNRFEHANIGVYIPMDCTDTNWPGHRDIMIFGNYFENCTNNINCSNGGGTQVNKRVTVSGNGFYAARTPNGVQFQDIDGLTLENNTFESAFTLATNLVNVTIQNNRIRGVPTIDNVSNLRAEQTDAVLGVQWRTNSSTYPIFESWYRSTTGTGLKIGAEYAAATMAPFGVNENMRFFGNMCIVTNSDTNITGTYGLAVGTGNVGYIGDGTIWAKGRITSDNVIVSQNPATGGIVGTYLKSDNDVYAARGVTAGDSSLDAGPGNVVATNIVYANGGVFTNSLTLNGVPVLTNVPAGGYGSTNMTDAGTNVTFQGGASFSGPVTINGNPALTNAVSGTGGSTNQSYLLGTNDVFVGNVYAQNFIAANPAAFMESNGLATVTYVAPLYGAVSGTNATVYLTNGYYQGASANLTNWAIYGTNSFQSAGVYQAGTAMLTNLSGIGSGASGDLMYRDANRWTNLAKSTDAKVLTLSGGLPSWQTPSAGAAMANTMVGTNLTATLLAVVGAQKTNLIDGPANGVGYLNNNGSGTLTWGNPTGSTNMTDVGTNDTFKGVIFAHNIVLTNVPDFYASNGIQTLAATAPLFIATSGTNSTAYLTNQSYDANNTTNMLVLGKVLANGGAFTNSLTLDGQAVLTNAAAFQPTNGTLTAIQTSLAGNTAVTNLTVVGGVQANYLKVTNAMASRVALLDSTSTLTNATVDIAALSLNQAYDNIWVDSGAMRPATSTAPEAGTFTHGQLLQDLLSFDSGGGEYAQFRIMMPDNWDLGTLSAKFVWSTLTTNTVSNVVQWGIAALALTNGMNSVSATFGTTQTVWQAHNNNTTRSNTVMITAATPAMTVNYTNFLGNPVYFVVTRTALTSTTNANADGSLHGVNIQYRKKTTQPAAWQ